MSSYRHCLHFKEFGKILLFVNSALVDENDSSQLSHMNMIFSSVLKQTEFMNQSATVYCMAKK